MRGSGGRKRAVPPYAHDLADAEGVQWTREAAAARLGALAAAPGGGRRRQVVETRDGTALAMGPGVEDESEKVPPRPAEVDRTTHHVPDHVPYRT